MDSKKFKRDKHLDCFNAMGPRLPSLFTDNDEWPTILEDVDINIGYSRRHITALPRL